MIVILGGNPDRDLLNHGRNLESICGRHRLRF